MTSKIKILVDLKPALDGYAGVPQETRLLFKGLRLMPDVDVEGLIQHGGRRLRAAVPTRVRGKPLSHAKRIDKLSKVIVSLHENPYSSLFDSIVEEIERYFALSILRGRTVVGGRLQTGAFDAGLFNDFIWRTFFDKTLKPADKALVTSAQYRVLKTSKKLMHQVGLAGLRYTDTPRYALLDTKGFDVLLAQTPFPARVTQGTQMVVRYHDAVPILMPHTVKDKAFHQASHFHALQSNVRSGAWFSCISEATRRDLLNIFPEAEPHCSVIHNMVSDEYFDEASSRSLIGQIARNRLAKVDTYTTDISGFNFDEHRDRQTSFDYLLMVSTLEPRKNHLRFVEAWERLKYTTHPRLKLVIVGSRGWDDGAILDAFRPWAERGDLFYLTNVPSAELRVLYKHASLTVCPSVAEGFDYSGIEAMRSGGVVVSSDIAVHREIYADASAYFDPYSTDDTAAVVGKLLTPEAEALRAALRHASQRIADRYTPHAILPQWSAFFTSIQQAGRSSN